MAANAGWRIVALRLHSSEMDEDEAWRILGEEKDEQ